jgi:hypothetical protein
MCGDGADLAVEMNWLDSIKKIFGSGNPEHPGIIFEPDFTPRCRQVLAFAGKEAERLRHTWANADNVSFHGWGESVLTRKWETDQNLFVTSSANVDLIQHQN